MSISLQPHRSVAAQVTRLLNRLASQVRTTSGSPGPEAIHDLRVATRRFTQALTVFKPCFAGKEVKKIRRRLKIIMSLAGEARDCDIALEYLAKLRAPGVPSLKALFQNKRKLAESGLVVTLKEWLATRTASAWRTALKPAGGAALVLRPRDPLPNGRGSLPEQNRARKQADERFHAVEDLARTTLAGMGQEFVKAGNRAAGAGASGTELHEFRIAAKKFRYTIELFAPLYGNAAKEWLERIARVQTVLGRINDFRAVRKMVSRAGDYKQVVESLRQRQRRKTAEFQKLWAEEFSPAAARQWLRALASPPRKQAGRAAAPPATATAAAAAS